MTKLHELAVIGQSIWLDYIRRDFLISGELSALIEMGIRGMTSNPTIFEKAISSSALPQGSKPGEYDSDLKKLSSQGKSAVQIYEDLAIQDIKTAADLLRPVYEQSGGADGFVSLEVNPTKAHQTGATVDEAKRLWGRVARPNLMVKIPATREGLPAITQAIAAGINVNVTLIFSLKRYQEVMDSYLKGLELRVGNGQPLSQIASVASFFVSRIDTKIDSQLEMVMREEGPRSARSARMLGKAAVANAKLAYNLFQEVFNSRRFTVLAEKGARLQRPLWASTSTKNPAYSDILYVQELIGSHTVNTVPKNTLDAFLDHGEVRESIIENVDKARIVLEELENLGISMDSITQELENEGVESFSNSFISLLESIEKRRKESTTHPPTISFNLGSFQSLVDHAIQEFRENNILDRIWDEDYSVWKPDPKEITNRLGWLHVHQEMMTHIPQVEAVRFAVHTAGYTKCVILGMGGSSLAPDLFGKIFASQPSEDSMTVEVLDSTDPVAVSNLEQLLDPHQTLLVISTKSGTTEETLSLFKYFYNWIVRNVGEQSAGEHFIAITDPGSKLVDLAKTYHFRSIFLNDPNIGGRYSALSYFGLVPAAFSGVDLERLLKKSEAMFERCKEPILDTNNPGIQLGVTLGELAKSGIDKLTISLPRRIASFGDWVEQLIAESTGKDRRGILPVTGERIGAPDTYEHDRLFVFFTLTDDRTNYTQIGELEAAGFPVIRISLDNAYDLGGQFFLWEFATAVAGYRLGIQPFDQPNVESAKALAREQIAAYKKTGRLPDQTPAIRSADITVFGETEAQSPEEAFIKFLAQSKPGDYTTLQAFLPPNPDTEEALTTLREKIRKATHRATTLGYGPRFLHSTGQLHKGDAGNGLFVQFTSVHSHDLEIPDEAGSPNASVTFGVLIDAQALGDFQALRKQGRRVIRFHFSGEPPHQIGKLAESLP